MKATQSMLQQMQLQKAFGNEIIKHNNEKHSEHTQSLHQRVHDLGFKLTMDKITEYTQPLKYTVKNSKSSFPF